MIGPIIIVGSIGFALYSWGKKKAKPKKKKRGGSGVELPPVGPPKPPGPDGPDDEQTELMRSYYDRAMAGAAAEVAKFDDPSTERTQGWLRSFNAGSPGPVYRFNVYRVHADFATYPWVAVWAGVSETGNFYWGWRPADTTVPFGSYYDELLRRMSK